MKGESEINNKTNGLARVGKCVVSALVWEVLLCHLTFLLHKVMLSYKSFKLV